MRYLSAAVLLLAAMSAAGAQPPAIDGLTFRGTGTTRDLACPPDIPPESESGPATFVITSQSGSAFTGTVRFLDFQGTFSGQVDPDGKASGSGSGQDPDGGVSSFTFTGTFAPASGVDRFTLLALGSGQEGCSFEFRADASTGRQVVPEAAAPSVVTTATLQQLAVTSGAIVDVGSYLGGILGRSRSSALRLGPGGLSFASRGLSAGEGMDAPWGVWGNLGVSVAENDFASTAFQLERFAFTVGADLSPREGIIVGAAVGIDGNDVETDFNGGHQDITGLTIAPYAAFTANEWLSADVMAGFTSVQTHQFRTVAALGTRVTSDVDGHRWFAAGNVDASVSLGALYLSGRAGLLWVRDSQDGFRESDGTPVPPTATKLGRFSLGAEAAWALGSWEPFASASWNHSYTQTRLALAGGVPAPESDRSDVLLGLGVRYYDPRQGLSASLEYSRLLGRPGFDQHTLGLILRGEF